MVERAKPVMRAIKLTPPRPSARASSATNRRRLCSFRTGAICRYRLRAARACAARIMHPSYVARFLAVNPLHAFLRRLWQHRLSCLWTGPKGQILLAGKRFQDRTVRHLVAAALGGHGTQDALEALQVSDPVSDVGYVLLGYGFDLCTGHPAATTKPQKLADLVEREAQLARTPNENEALRMFVGVEPMPAGAARRIWQNTDSLVIANGLDVHLGLLGKRADGQSRICVHF